MIVITKLKKFLQLGTNPRLAVFFGASLTVFVFGFLLFSFTYLFYGTEIAVAESKKSTVATGKYILEIHVANNGLVYLRGAKVVSINGTTMVVDTSWNSSDFKWKVITNEAYYGTRHFGTSFLNSKGKNIVITDIKIGDIITISGDLDKNQKEPTVKADTIRTPY